MIAFYITILLAVAGEYFTAYPNESREAVKTFDRYRDRLVSLLGDTGDDDVVIAFSIVAPEVSQYSALSDFFETAAVKDGYPSAGSPDYSIGLFQMKPSFAESLETEVTKDSALKQKYGARLAYGTDDIRKVRRQRVERLSDTGWQMLYLAVFVDVVKRRTATWGLASSEEKVRCWSTLYNAGFYLSRERVRQRQGVKQFPRNAKRFNYSAVAVEFFNALSGR